MILFDKTYSENPFLDNVIYYAKTMAANATVKDEEEALANESKESLYAADVLIACVEGRATYEMFESIPMEILEKYIAMTTNLDIYVKDPKWLQNHMDSYIPIKRNAILNRLSQLARTTYIDHYNIMANYITDVGTDWLINHEDLYWKCKDGTATYMDLFDELPTRTTLRIIRAYLNSHGYLDLAMLWDPDSSVTKSDLALMESQAKQSQTTDDDYASNSTKTLLLDINYVMNADGYDASNSDQKNQFLAYIMTRSDDVILSELANISKAMRDVFASHYEIMRDRQYFSYKTTADIDAATMEPGWMGYTYDADIYKRCQQAKATWVELWPYFPEYAIKNALDYILGASEVATYNLMSGGIEAVEYYLNHIADNATAKKIGLNEYMINDYLGNYQIYLNKSIYDECVAGTLTIYDLYEYLPKETLKSILNTEIDITTNLEAFSKSKTMLNSYLETLPTEEADRIKAAITADMIIWYPKHHVEKNNYYRALIGLPPLDEKGEPYEDTLIHSWLPKTKEFLEFGNRYLSQCPTDTYTENHWKQELYKFDNYDVNILNDLGILDAWVSTPQPNGCGSNMNVMRYRYLKYLGDNKLDLYQCRKAANFELIGIPSVDDTDIRNKFTDAYATNREYVIRCVYDDAYAFQSDYYNKFIILFILVNTIMDVCAQIPDYIINREVFDARCIKYIFESVGIPYYDEIPVKYQHAMLKNLNTLLKYKASTRNMVDICSLFGFSDVQVYGYYLMKHRTRDKDNNFIPDENNDITYNLDNVYVRYKDGDIQDVSGLRYCKLSAYPFFKEQYYLKTVSVLNPDGSTTQKKIINNDREDLYVFDNILGEMIRLKDSTYFKKIKANTKPAELDFIRVPVNDQLNNFKSDEDYIASYDEITQEETWDGGLDHESLKQKILEYAFNAVKSKYISIDAVTDLTEITFQTAYFYNMLFDDLYAENLLTVNLNFLQSGHPFRLADVVIFMFAMAYYYMGLEDKIMYSPSQILYVKGYSFTDAVNAILNDDRCFAQTDEEGNALAEKDKYNIFDVNQQISEHDYNYREAFTNMGLKLKSFNLDADIDALEKWLNEECQMSLSDFIVSEDVEEYGQIVTLMQFYSLHNSYYQKDIFSGPMIPYQYNNLIKYAYGSTDIPKIKRFDVSGNVHDYLEEHSVAESNIGKYGRILDVVALVCKGYKRYSYDHLLDLLSKVRDVNKLTDYAYILRNLIGITDDVEISQLTTSIDDTYYSLIIDTKDPREIYVLNNTTYARRSSNAVNRIAIYNKYVKDGTSYKLASDQYYVYDKSIDAYNILISGFIYVRNGDGVFTFACDKVFKSNNAGMMSEIDYNKYTVFDPEINAMVLNYGDYYVRREDGTYVLNPDNCYVLVNDNGVDEYRLLKDIEDYVAQYVNTDNCYIRLDSGKFVDFKYTDFYVRTHHDSEQGNEMVYEEKPLYIKVNYETDYYDPDEPDVYYRPLEDFYRGDFMISTDCLYVKDTYGNFIKEDDLLIPTNTYFYDAAEDQYNLISVNQFEYEDYEDPLNVLYVLVLQTNYDYMRYIYESATQSYIQAPSDSTRYIYNSNSKVITALNVDATYAATNKITVVLNKEYVNDTDITAEDNQKYNPSLNDNVWDENDWYYPGTGSDDTNVTGMDGENIWYYHKGKPAEIAYGGSSSNLDVDNIGSGFYFNGSSFIGSVELVKGEEYFMAMDITCNFSGDIQVGCTFDPEMLSSQNKIYSVVMGQTLHINQTFRSNATGQPQIRILKYGFTDNPIHVGDMVTIENVKFTKSYSTHYIPTDIPTIDDLLRIYKTNKAIYNWLLTQLHNTHDKRTYDIYKKLYDSLMVSEYNKEIFKLPNGEYALTYTDFLRSRDSILYDTLMNIKSMDKQTAENTISNYIIDICYILTEYLAKGNLDQLYNGLPGVSISFVQQYLIKVINWFKSWKVQMLGINTLYKLGHGARIDADGNLIADQDGDEFMVHVLHNQDYYVHLKEYLKDSFIKDTIKINPLDGISPDGTPYKDKYDLPEFTNVYDDEVAIRHRVRVMVDNGNSLEYTDSERNLRFNLNDDSTNVAIKDDHELVVTTINGDEFTVSDKNKLIMTTDEDPEDVFTGQVISEINLMSGDYVTDHEAADSDEDDIDGYE